jgi:hypothetical protein
MCHTLWHRLNLDFMSDDSDTGRLAEYTCGSAVPHSQRDRQLISARHLTAVKISDGPSDRLDA